VPAREASAFYLLLLMLLLLLVLLLRLSIYNFQSSKLLVIAVMLCGLLTQDDGC